jgi:hypothetical protein
MKLLAKIAIVIVAAIIGYFICNYRHKKCEDPVCDKPHQTDSTDRLAKKQLVPFTNPFGDENDVYLEFCEVTANEGKAESEKCHDYLRVNTKKLKLELATVLMTEWTKLRAKALLEKPANCSNYVTGVKIAFGINTVATNDHLTLIYTPVIFCRNAVSYGQQSEIFGTYALHEADPQVLVGTQFDLATNQGIDPVTYENNYFERVKFDRGDDDVFDDPLVQGNNYVDDTKSVIFTFQEIFELSKANGNAASTIIYNSMRDIVLPGQDNLVKHSLIMTYTGQTVKPQQFYGAKSMTGKYCNLSHMCPPSCNGVLFNFRLKSL